MGQKGIAVLLIKQLAMMLWDAVPVGHGNTYNVVRMMMHQVQWWYILVPRWPG
jgi:hypothetical protein